MVKSMVIGWECLNPLFASNLFIKIDKFVNKQRKTKTIFPVESKVFRSLELSSFKHTKVIILGQDPYHNENQATGISFSVAKNVKIPPSLKNIQIEMHNDVGAIFTNGDLTYLAKQGVLFLNTILTVQKNKPNSHTACGWQDFSEQIIKILSSQKKNLVFLLWGENAKQKLKLIDKHKHLILTASHPSPLSAYHSFFGCKHFSQTNAYLLKNNLTPITWKP